MKDSWRFLYITAKTRCHKKKRVNNMQLEFKAGNNKEYKVDDIWNSAVYVKELAKHLLGLYYLVL